ncbi:MAG: radical SAM protein [Sulfolobaceae archaeon]
MIVKSIRVKSALSESGLKELDYSLNPYLGCNFSCTYCYAPNFTPNREASLNWGKVIIVKENILEVLKKEVFLKRKGIVGISTITDPYQPIEALKRITRECISLLLNHNFRVSIQTKSPLVLRDLDILVENKGKVDVGITITSFERWRELEPNAPSPRARLRALERISNEGVETWLFLGPIIRGINDHEIEDIVREASGIRTRIVFDKFRFYKGLNYKEGGIGWWKRIREEVLKYCKRYNIECHEESEDWIYERRRFFKPLF